MIRLFNWFRRGSLERGLDRELQYHFDRQIYLLDPDFQHIAGLSFLDRYGPSQNVPARTFVGYFFMNVAQILGNV